MAVAVVAVAVVIMIDLGLDVVVDIVVVPRQSFVRISNAAVTAMPDHHLDVHALARTSIVRYSGIFP